MRTKEQALKEILPDMLQMSDKDVGWLGGMVIEFIAARANGKIRQPDASTH